jgi:hypothetical protein
MFRNMRRDAGWMNVRSVLGILSSAITRNRQSIKTKQLRPTPTDDSDIQCETSTNDASDSVNCRLQPIAATVSGPTFEHVPEHSTSHAAKQQHRFAEDPPYESPTREAPPAMKRAPCSTLQACPRAQRSKRAPCSMLQACPRAQRSKRAPVLNAPSAPRAQRSKRAPCSTLQARPVLNAPSVPPCTGLQARAPTPSQIRLPQEPREAAERPRPTEVSGAPAC